MNIEPLESRIAPAVTVLNATTASFTDVDGDLVTIKFSKAIAQQVLYTTTFGAPSITGAEQLLRIDLINVAPAAAAGVNITITAVPKDGNGDGLKDGDGHVNVGELRASGIHLGAVSMRGDLGRIFAGDSSATVPALKSLSVDSMGEYGLSSGASVSRSELRGPVGSILVKGNVRAASIYIDDGFTVRFPLGTLAIGGSLIGGDANATGVISCAAIGSVKIAGNLEGGLAISTGLITTTGKITSLTIGGSVLGLRGDFSGAIEAGALGNVLIGGDVRGDDVGGYITSAGAIGNVTIGGSLVGTYEGGGLIKAGGDIGAVKIGGDVQGGIGSAAGLGSGRIEAGGTIASVSVGGSLLGFAGDKSGSISSTGKLGPVTIGGNVLGHDGEFSASIRSDTRIDSVRIGGSVQGGSGGTSGFLYTPTGGMGAVTIAHDLIGGYGSGSARIFAFSGIASVRIGGSILGGSGVASASIDAGFGALPSIVIGGSVIGGADPDPFDTTFEGSSSAAISANALGTVSIGGDLIGHAQFSGRVDSGTTIAKMQIGGSIYGGELEESGVVSAVGRIASLSVGGDVVSGYRPGTGRIFGGAIDSLVIGGSVRGDFHGTVESTALIESPGAIGTLSIGGNVVGWGEKSGYISGALGIKTLTIGGSLIGSSSNDSGVVSTGGILGTAKIGGDIRGGDNFGATVTNTGAVLAKQITSLTVSGSIFSGTQSGGGALTRSGSITADETIGALTVKGSLIGNETLPVLITAGGKAPIAPTIAKPEPGIGAITIGGRVDHTFILVGYNKNGIGVSADASVGAVKVGGDWIASYLSAGVEPGTDLIFGTADDRLLPGGANFGGGPVRDNLSVSKIASIVIGGQIKNGYVAGFPVPQGNQTYSFVAQQIGSFKYDDIVVPLTAGASNDTFALGKARPLGASRSSLNTDGFAMHVFEV